MSLPPRKKAREKPLLIPSCRKLRHLQSVSIRNLTLHRAPASTPRTQDDTDVRLTPVTDALSEFYAGHSRSSTDLVSKSDFEKWKDGSSSGKGFGSPRRDKGKGKAISGSLGSTSGGSPLRRRQRGASVYRDERKDVEQANDREELRLPDCFFSLHVGGEEVCYISEVVQKSLNPTFQDFSLSDLGPELSRADSLTIKVWVDETGNGDSWVLLLELELALEALQFIGKSLETFRHPLTQNCVVFHLIDGCYTAFTDMAPSEPPIPEGPRLDRLSEYKDTSSYDSLLRMRTVEECIYDAEKTQFTVSAQIDTLLTIHAASVILFRQLPESKESLNTLKDQISLTRKRVNRLRTHLESLKQAKFTRQSLLSESRSALDSSGKHLSSAHLHLSACTSTLEATRESLQAQRRRILGDLSKIYPIEPATAGASDPLSFSIRGLPLPNSTSTFAIPDDILSAALGYTAHLVHNLALYLSVPLRYPIIPQGSTSHIHDPISQLQGSRVFPLYRNGQRDYRFEYGVFLLNKDVELLCASCGMSVVDIRHTLPNLKYLMYIVGEWGRRERLVK